MTRLDLARTIPVALAALVAVSLAAPPAAAQESDPLDPRQRDVLEHAVGTAVAPTAVPAGWSADRSEVAVGPDGAIDYRIVYRGPDGACFEVVGGPAEGFGGPVPPNHRQVPIEALSPGEGTRIHWSTGEEPDGPFPKPVVFSDWIPFGRLAHRFASPASPIGTCPAVDPDTAAEVVASLAPVGPPEAAPIDAGAEEAGDWQWLVFNDPTVERRPGEPVEATALRVLEAIGLGLSPEERAGEAAVTQTVEIVGRDPAVVRVTREGGGDDSVAGVRYRVVLEPEGEGRWFFRIGRAVRCQPGRGHAGWSRELCL